MQARLRDHAFRAGCAVWVVLAVAFWVQVFRGGDDLLDPAALEVPENPLNLDVEVADDLRVSGAAFGVRVDFGGGGGVPLFLETKHVPLAPGQDFGWIVWVDTDRQQVRWREVFTSASPDNWQVADDGSYALSEDGATMTREVTADVVEGRIQHFWSVAEGDLPGPHRIQLFVEDVPVADFAFEVSELEP